MFKNYVFFSLTSGRAPNTVLISPNQGFLITECQLISAIFVLPGAYKAFSGIIIATQNPHKIIIPLNSQKIPYRENLIEAAPEKYGAVR